MSKKVVLAEKPSVGRDIAKVLNCNKKGNGYFEGDQYIVTWALGHLVTLADPEVYDDRYKTWKLEDLPMLPKSLKLAVIKKTGKQFSAVKAQMNRKDVNEIIIATDAGREGELVARWIIEKARTNKPVKRLWISSVTDKAIKEGFKKLRDGKHYENLYASAVARSEADWYVGLNATRALTTKHNAQLSCGRVQTPTLAMIAEREKEIKEFKPKTYYGIQALTDGLTLTWHEQKSNDTRTFDETKRDKILANIKDEKAIVNKVDKKTKKSYAPQLYDLTELQKDAYKLFGYSAKETLSTLQTLYERYKVVTYPRTDSRYLTTDIVDTFGERIQACKVGEYREFANQAEKYPKKLSKAYVDNDKVSDHHAIIPTEQTAPLTAFGSKERKIYDLIAKRFLAVFYPAFTYEQTSIEVKIGTEIFRVKGKRVIDNGWKEVFQYEENEQDTKLPLLTEGEERSVTSLKKTTGETKPPQLFNEGTLLAAMENPTRFMSKDNKALVDTIGKTGGLGTVATRADIIDKLFNTFLIEKTDNGIRMTSKGRQLLELVPTTLKSPELTAEWEQKLEQIEKGNLNQGKFINEMKDFTREIVSEIKGSDQTFKHDNITGTKCPECGNLMLEVKTKKGKMLVCKDRECNTRKNVSKVTNARCPKCRKKLVLRGQGEGQMFTCTCGHREKLSTFNERKKKNNNKKVSKREVNKYMKKQDQNEPINTALADQLAQLKNKLK